MSWEDEHYEAWEKENKRAAQEKHEEKYWSEIEDGVCPPTPSSPKVDWDTPEDHIFKDFNDLSFEEQLKKLSEYFKNGRKV